MPTRSLSNVPAVAKVVVINLNLKSKSKVSLKTKLSWVKRSKIARLSSSTVATKLSGLDLETDTNLGLQSIYSCDHIC